MGDQSQIRNNNCEYLQIMYEYFFSFHSIFYKIVAHTN